MSPGPSLLRCPSFCGVYSQLNSTQLPGDNPAGRTPRRRPSSREPSRPRSPAGFARLCFRLCWGAGAGVWLAWTVTRVSGAGDASVSLSVRPTCHVQVYVVCVRGNRRQPAGDWGPGNETETVQPCNNQGSPVADYHVHVLATEVNGRPRRPAPCIWIEPQLPGG